MRSRILRAHFVFRGYMQQQSTATITPSELDAPPVTGVGDLVIRALGTGVSAAMLTCAGAWMLQQPADVIGKAAGVAFLVVTGGAGTWLLLSADAWRKARARHHLTERKLHAAYVAIQRLEYTIADQRETISRLQASKPAAQPVQVQSNRVLRYNLTDNNVACATKIINYWLQTLHQNKYGETVGEWYSRAKATDSGSWSQTDHNEAVRLLKDMNIIEQEQGKIPRILPRFTNLGATIAHFNKLCADALAEPDIPSRNAVMSNGDDDD